MNIVEADKSRFIITGDTAADVYSEAQNITKRCGSVFVSFTNPVMQADQRFVSIGNVVIVELE